MPMQSKDHVFDFKKPVCGILLSQFVVFVLCWLSSYAFQLIASEGLSLVCYHYIDRVRELRAQHVDVMVIGGGCAGLAAGFTLAHHCFKVAICMGDNPGGQLLGAQWVENMPGIIAEPGSTIVERLEHTARQAGAQIIYERVVEVVSEKIEDKPLFVISDSAGQVWTATAIILAMGAVPRLLNVPGEEQYLYNQIFTCARCDGKKTAGARVYVVGGGDASFDAISTLIGFGAQQCILLVRKSALRASPALCQRLTCNPQVRVEFNTELIGVEGSAEELEAVILRTPQGIQKRPAAFVCYAVGHLPNTQSSWVRSLVECNEQGYVKVSSGQQTSAVGVFAAGDITDRPFHQASYAIGCAQFAAKSAIDFVQTIFTDEFRSALHRYIYMS